MKIKWLSPHWWGHFYRTGACFPPVKNMKNTHQMLVFMILRFEVTTTLTARVNKSMKASMTEHERRVWKQQTLPCRRALLACWCFFYCCFSIIAAVHFKTCRLIPCWATHTHKQFLPETRMKIKRHLDEDRAFEVDLLSVSSTDINRKVYFLTLAAELGQVYQKIKSCNFFVSLLLRLGGLGGACIWRWYCLMVQLMRKFWRKSQSLRGIWLPPSIICTVSNREAHHLSSVSFASSTPALPVYAFTFFISCLSWRGKMLTFPSKYINSTSSKNILNANNLVYIW